MNDLGVTREFPRKPETQKLVGRHFSRRAFFVGGVLGGDASGQKKDRRGGGASTVYVDLVQPVMWPAGAGPY